MNARTHIILILFAFFLLVCLVAIALTFVSLIRRGDERRQMIIARASTWSFLAVMGSIVIRIIARLSGVTLNADSISVLFSTLVAGSIVFLISFALYRSRYGG